MAKKKVQDQGAQIPRNAAQHRYWTFYEAIKFAADTKEIP